MSRYECHVFDRDRVRADHPDHRVCDPSLIHDATDYFYWLDQNGIEWVEHINCLRKRGWISYHLEVPQALAQTYEITWVEQRNGVEHSTPKAPPNTPAPFPHPCCRSFKTTCFPDVLITTSRKHSRLFIFDLNQREQAVFTYNQNIDAFVAWCRANGCKLITRGFCLYHLECRDEASFELFKLTWYRTDITA